MGMVIGPSITTLDTALPDTVPNSVEAITATLAGPPRSLPIVTSAKSVSAWSPRAAYSTRPNRMNGMMIVAVTASGVPSIPLESR